MAKAEVRNATGKIPIINNNYDYCKKQLAGQLQLCNNMIALLGIYSHISLIIAWYVFNYRL